MTVDVKDLPPAYQAQALRKLMEQERKKGRGPIPSPAASTPQPASKYHNKPTERVTASGAVLHFDSQKEARRYDELVEDVKSRATKTKQYAMKRKMMQEHFGIYIQEV